MEGSKISRRNVLVGASALAAGAAFSTRVVSAAPPASASYAGTHRGGQEGRQGCLVHLGRPEIVGADRQGFRGQVSGRRLQGRAHGRRTHLAAYWPEYTANVHAVDVVNSSDASHLVYWKDQGVLEPYVPEDVAKFYPAEHKDADGTYASFRVFLCIIAYNTSMVKKEEAPKSFADLLDAKWKGKIVKAHPGYSGTIMTATYQMSRDLGWEYFEKLAQQNISAGAVGCRSAEKIALGERAVQADGVEYLIFQEKESGQPVEPVYATEGNPLIIGPNGLFKAAPNPNAARLFQSFCFSPDCQQLCIDIGGLRSVHPQIKEHTGRTPLSQIKTMKDDAAAVLKNGEQIKARYTKIFRV